MSERNVGDAVTLRYGRRRFKWEHPGINEYHECCNKAIESCLRLRKPFFVYEAQDIDQWECYVNSDERPDGTGMRAARSYTEFRPDGTTFHHAHDGYHKHFYITECKPFDPAYSEE